MAVLNKEKYQKFVYLKKLPMNIRGYVKERFKLTDTDLDKIEFNGKEILEIAFWEDDNDIYHNNAFNILSQYTPQQLLDVIDYLDVRTKSRIQATPSLGVDDEVEFDFTDGIRDDDNILIKDGTWLFFPTDFLTKTLPFFRESQTVAPFTKFSSFVDDSIKRIIEDERYTRSARVGDNSEKNASHIHNLNISVTWMSKAIEAGFKKANAITEAASLFSQKAIDLTPFVISCSTNVGKIGGGFQLVLAPIVIECIDETWQLKKGTVNFRDKGAEFYQDAYSTTPNAEGKNKRQIFAFHHILQPNDLIAIKFEELEIERNADTGESKRDSTNLSANSGVTFYDAIKGTPEDENNPDSKNGDTLDMLGLIDSTTVSENATNGDVNISIKGTDFSKMLHKDGALFFAGAGDTTFSKPSDYSSIWFLNDQAELSQSTSFERLFTSYRVEGEIKDVNLFLNKPLRFWLEFIRTKLSSSKITLEDFIKERKPLALGTDYQHVKSEDGEFGIWQLIKLIVDPEIDTYEISDSTIAASSGNLMSFVQKVCQDPFVEFFCDTYGDKYYWIARKPPFAKEAFLDPVGVQHIDDADLENYSLSFSDEDIYSWYKLKSILWYQGGNDQSGFNDVSVFFPQFADLYGARAKEVSSQYIDYGLLGVNAGNGLKQAMNDMRWLIETTAHLFATRKGTITLSGKRTIKRGMRVYLESTDELFYVDSVQNSYNVGRGGTDRTTVVTVSRGIVLSHSERYFNVIDFKEDIEDVDVSQVGSEEAGTDANPKRVVKKWQVNEENFYFLIQRLQWCQGAPPSATFKEERVRQRNTPKFNTGRT